jgi:DNA-binding CsgD family transcriptional regulator
MSLAEIAEPEVRGPRQVEWFERLDEEQDNFRAALVWARKTEAGGSTLNTGEAEEPEPVEIGLRTAAALHRYWYMRNHFSEGREHLHSLLDLDNRLPGGSSRLPLRVRALLGEAALAERQDQVTLAWELNQEALAISRALGDKQGIALALHSLAACGWITDMPARLPLLEESRTLFEELGDTWNLARATFQIAVVAELSGNHSEARELFLQGQAMFEQIGDIACVAHGLLNLGMIDAEAGDYDSAVACIRRNVALNTLIRNNWGKATALTCLQNIGWLRGDLTDIRSLAAEAASIHRDLGASDLTAQSLLSLARMDLIEGNMAEAARLLGESLTLLRVYNPDAHELYLEATILYFQGLCAQKQGALCLAAGLFRYSLSIEFPQGYIASFGALRAARALAALAALGGASPVRAATLAGAAQAIVSTSGLKMHYDERIEYEQNLATVRARVNEGAAWQVAWEAGQALSIQEAIDYALQEMPLAEPASPTQVGAPVRAARPAQRYGNDLSPREVEVLHLLAEGLSNQQIAERLSLSSHTVRAHLHSIYNKLDVSTRGAAIRFANVHRLIQV